QAGRGRRRTALTDLLKEQPLAHGAGGVFVEGIAQIVLNAASPKSFRAREAGTSRQSSQGEPRMSATTRKLAILSAAAALIAASSGGALAQKKYDTGASDTEIKIGNIMPYSGPASAYGVIGKTEAAYFKKINDAGGVNGRKINFISYDDGYSPPKTVEQARKLVESDEVLFIFNSLGTPPNSAIHK